MFILILLLMITVFSIATYVVMCIELKRLYDLIKIMSEKEIEFEQRDIKEEKPTAEELKTWWRKSGLPLKRFFNTSGKLYKEMQLKDRIPNMSEDEQIELLASDGMLVKRPILVQNEKVLVGFKEKEWQEIL